MRLMLLAVSASFLMSSASSYAMDCTGGVRSQLKCLNTKNAALENRTSKLEARITEMQGQIDKLSKQISAIDLSNVIKYGSKVQLESLVHFGTCLDHDTGNPAVIHGWPCNGGQAWKLNAR